MITIITNFLINFSIFQQIQSQIIIYLKFTKMDITRFAMKLFKYTPTFQGKIMLN